LLPIKSYQLYQNVILLKYHLTDLLPQYNSTTNLFPLQAQSIPGTTSDNIVLNKPLDSPNNSIPFIDLVIELIDQLIDSLMLSHNLKAIVTTISQGHDIQLYTDSSL